MERKQTIRYWAVVLALVCLLLPLLRESRYLKTFTAMELDSTVQTVTTADSRYADPSYLEAGLFMYGPGVYLEPGSFSLTMMYSTDGAGSYVEVYSLGWLNEDNTQGRVLATLTLDPAQTQARVDFSLDRTVDDLEFRVYYGGEGALTVNTLTLRSGYLYWTDPLLLIFFVLALAGLLYAAARRGRPQAAVVAALIGLALLASYPLFTDFLTVGMDQEFHLRRIEGLFGALQSGQWPARISTQHFGGKGYATGVMYPELFLYFPAALRLAGASLLFSWKALLFAVNLGTAFSAYFCGRRLMNSRAAGMAAAIVYLLSPYRLCDLYIRAALGEALAMAFLPLLLYGLWQLLAGDAGQWPWLVLACTGVFQSHILSTEMAAVFAALCALAALPALTKPARLAALGKAAGLTVLVNLWFLVPFLTYTLKGGFKIFGSHVDLHQHALYPAQMFSTFWSADPGLWSQSLGSLDSEMLLTLGLAPLVCLGLLAAGWWLFDVQSGPRPGLRQGVAAAVVAGLCLYAASVYFPWELLQRIPALDRLLSPVQFPWRTLAFAAACFAVVAAAATIPFRGRGAKMAVLGVLLAAAVLPASSMMDGLLASQVYMGQTDGIAHIGGNYNEYLPEGVNDETLAAASSALEPQSELEVSGLTKNGCRIEFDYTAQQDTVVYLPLTAYPGYSARLNGQTLDLTAAPDGRLAVTLPAGSGHLTVDFAGYWYWNAALAVSAFTVLAWGAKTVYERRKRGESGGAAVSV
ncbi:hypothetical protein [Candidatus Allofournierella merdipullorum]|uniref:hypothetical protein n=1 Tax=Candidatus Allofournierella merdipullorum TaxID=2838595 RepID=UPI00374F39B5